MASNTHRHAHRHGTDVQVKDPMAAKHVSACNGVTPAFVTPFVTVTPTRPVLTSGTVPTKRNGPYHAREDRP